MEGSQPGRALICDEFLKLPSHVRCYGRGLRLPRDPMTIDAVLSLLAGLGLFFIGVKNLRVTMGQMTGRRMQHWVSRAASHPVFGAVIGALSGALTQSTNAVTIILVSLAQTGLLGAADAAPILAWSNVGTSLLVFAAAIR